MGDQSLWRKEQNGAPDRSCVWGSASNKGKQATAPNKGQDICRQAHSL